MTTSPDYLSFGPIATASADRAAWLERETRKVDLRGHGAAWAASWSAALASGQRRYVWRFWRSAQEYRGFLAFVSRLGDSARDAVGLSDEHIRRPAPRDGGGRITAGALAMLTPDAIPAGGFLDRAEPLAPERRADALRLWSRLRSDDAPLRVPAGNGGLVSAPLSHFDAELLRHTPRDWWPIARTVAHVLAEFLDTGLYRVGDRFLAARVHALAVADRVELRGGDPRRGLAGKEIRLAASAPPP